MDSSKPRCAPTPEMNYSEYKTPMVTSSTISDTSRPSFLTVPLEIRRLIYQYLVPNTTETVPCWALMTDVWPALRQDGEQCACALLRTNRQIYEEMVDLWYGSLTFLLRLDGRVRFLGAELELAPPIRFPSTMRYMKALHLRVSLLHRVKHTTKLVDYNPKMTQVVDQVLLAGGRPERLEVTLSIDVMFFREHILHIEGPMPSLRVKNGLRYNLEPLKNLQDVHITCWKIVLAYNVKTLHCADRNYKDALVNFERHVREYLSTIGMGFAGEAAFLGTKVLFRGTREWEAL